EGVLAGRGLVVEEGRAGARFLDRTQRADVLGGDEQVARIRIERSSAPIDAAKTAWKNQRARGSGAFRAITERGEWPSVLNAASLIDQVLTGFRVFGRGVGGGNKILRLVAHASQGRRLHRNGLRGISRLARNVAFRCRPLFNPENRLAGLAIQLVLVSPLR